MSEDVLPCGHHVSLFIRSTEGDYQFCELCEMRSERNDAVQMEEHYRARLTALESERDALREALGPFVRANRAIGDEPGPLRIETLRGYRLIDREDFRRAARAYSRSLLQDKGGRKTLSIGSPRE